MTRIIQRIFKNKLIILIILLALFLRLYDIGGNPKAMYGDELTLVYDAYSILKTGRDQKGEFMPLFFSMGGGRPAGYIYSTIPFAAVFGPSSLAARSVSFLSGLGIVILLYLICLLILNREIGLYAALLAAITPWNLSLSRGGFESHFALFLALLGIYFFYRAKFRGFWYFFSGLSFALSMQTYSTYVLIIPLFLILLFFIKKKIYWGYPVFCIILVAISLFFSIFVSIGRQSQDRFSNLFIYNQPGLQSGISGKVKVERLFSPLKPELAHGLHNKVLENAALLLENYAGHFSLDFIFVRGDQNPRHNPASMGQFFWFGLILIIPGISYLYSKNKQVLILISGWLIIAPLATALVGGPHALRSSFMMPPLILILASGMKAISLLKNRSLASKIKIITLIIFLIQLPFFINRFYLLSPNLNARFWSYSAKNATEMALLNKDKFDHIILSTSIPDLEFAFPVYSGVEPYDVIRQQNSKTHIEEETFFKFENIYLGSIPTGRVKNSMNSLKGSVLYLGPLEDMGKLDNEKIQRDKDSSPLFVISTKPE